MYDGPLIDKWSFKNVFKKVSFEDKYFPSRGYFKDPKMNQVPIELSMCIMNLLILKMVNQDILTKILEFEGQKTQMFESQPLDILLYYSVP